MRRSGCELAAHLQFDNEWFDLPLERLFDDLPGVVFFIKDHNGRYICVNSTLAERCGVAAKSELLGRLPSDLFPPPLAARYEQQDLRVVQTRRPVVDRLEIHFYPNCRRGWCITNKYPVCNRTTGRVAGLMGISRDVEATASHRAPREFPELARVLDLLHEQISQPPRIEELARRSDMSVDQLSRLVFRLFSITPRQLLMKMRLDEAMHLLTSTQLSLAEIAIATGFCDQSAFTRHFRRFTGMPPGVFRTQDAGPRTSSYDP